MLGGIVAEVISEFRGLPTNRHEASFYDVTCVLDMECMRNTDGKAGDAIDAGWIQMGNNASGGWIATSSFL